ncbi:putative oxidoreductase [Zancudomyces culisetae]|uniref:Putative oxidoreductase n=1 Tax=Zancudomyces culisetae TaxID=1213189 RepID=A0A1R1PZ16_ZANCU|nr:putative oxidoreductase [Zancudomyces culisetae]|eukprot:OMH86212.1 putative oxidoreductase [Zancudomyces culisetae]
MVVPSTSKVVIVTGASRGIGKAVCEELIKFGAIVIGFARSKEDLDQLSSKCNLYARELKFIPFIGDITSEQDCKSVVKMAKSKFGRIDALVNNAGTLEPVGTLVNISKQELIKAFDVNLFSVFYLTQLVLPELRKNKEGVVVNVSSGASTKHLQGWGAYCASKASLNMLTQGFASEEPDVTFIALRPGVVDTDMQTRIRASGDIMKPEEFVRFTDLKENKQLLSPNIPGYIIAKLALYAEHSLSGEFLSYDSEMLSKYLS